MKDASEGNKNLSELGEVPVNWSDPFLLDEQISESEKLILV